MINFEHLSVLISVIWDSAQDPQTHFERARSGLSCTIWWAKLGGRLSPNMQKLPTSDSDSGWGEEKKLQGEKHRHFLTWQGVHSKQTGFPTSFQINFYSLLKVAVKTWKLENTDIWHLQQSVNSWVSPRVNVTLLFSPQWLQTDVLHMLIKAKAHPQWNIFLPLNHHYTKLNEVLFRGVCVCKIPLPLLLSNEAISWKCLQTHHT